MECANFQEEEQQLLISSLPLVKDRYSRLGVPCLAYLLSCWISSHDFLCSGSWQCKSSRSCLWLLYALNISKLSSQKNKFKFKHFLSYLKDWKHFHCISKSSRFLKCFPNKNFLVSISTNYGSKFLWTFLCFIYNAPFHILVQLYEQILFHYFLSQRRERRTHIHKGLCWFSFFSHCSQLFESPAFHWKAFGSAVFCCNTWNLEKTTVPKARILAMANYRCPKLCNVIE